MLRSYTCSAGSLQWGPYHNVNLNVFCIVLGCRMASKSLRGRTILNYLLWDAFKQLPCLTPGFWSLGDYDEQLSKWMHTEQTTMEKLQTQEFQIILLARKVNIQNQKNCNLKILWRWWLMLVTLSLGRLGHEDCSKFEASQG